MRKPLRSYRAVYLASTSVSPMIQLLVDCDEQTLEALMRREGAIEGADILRVASRYKIRLNASLAPTLAWFLNFTRVTSPAEKPLDDGAQSDFDTAFFEQLVGDIAGIRQRLSKCIHADRFGQGLIHCNDRDGRAAVREIDTVRLAKWREELTEMGEYLARYVPETFHSETWHGDAEVWRHLLRQAVERKEPGFSNPTGTGVKFIQAVLIRAGITAEGIVGALRRHRDKVVAALQRLDIPK